MDRTTEVGGGRRARRHRGPYVAAWALVGALTAGCSGQPEREGDDGAGEVPAGEEVGTPAPAAADSTGWTAAVLSAPPRLDSGPPPVPVLTGFRTGEHPEYERMTVEVAGLGGLPGYRLEYVDRPLHECGSGRQIFPVGDGWLELRLEPAAAHTEAGQPTLGEREIDVGAPLIRRIYRTCDFEAVVTLVLAVSEPNRFRVLTLDDPPRLAVDVER